MTKMYNVRPVDESTTTGSNKIMLLVAILSILTTSMLVVNLVFSILSFYDNNSLQNIYDDHQAEPNLTISQQMINLNKQSYIDLKTKQFSYKDKTNRLVLGGTFGNSINYNDYKSIILRTKRSNIQIIHFKSLSRAANLELTITTVNHSNNITCNSYNWEIVEEMNNPAAQEFDDCFNINSKDSWYGGSEVSDQQFWPINEQDFGAHQPYLSGIFAKSSAVLERYWISSSGVAITVDYKTPLFVLKNKTNICLLGSAKEPYNPKLSPILNYDICQIDSTKNDYMNSLHLFMINQYLSKPSGVPDELMFKRPIWSTWAVYKKFIDEAKVEEYAKDILANNYSNSQLEIDDKWQTEYGDFTFDTSKFPDMNAFIKRINALGYRTTLWVHPFVNIEAKNFMAWAFTFITVRAPDGLRPLFTSWWDGQASFILDTTNTNATTYFVAELNKIRADTGIDSFKFDAGEFEWLPKNGWLANAPESPEQYCTDYARMASRLGPMIEIRVGCRTQDLPNFVRMIDRDSKWGIDNGLKSVITATLAFSIIGYPFVLPDMIGGNAYLFTDNGDIDFDTTEIAYPDYELFIRWTQVNAFLPAMQFSIPPWHYSNKTSVPVNKICKDLVELHESLVSPLLIKYANLATQTGEPIIRPLWWVDNTDSISYSINDQFLVGNEILVAPITDDKTYKRDIYIPKGNWKYINGTVYIGPRWLKSFPVPIEVVPYFINSNNF